jgi:hypothetical protein
LGRHFASEFAAANFERRASIGVSSQLRTLLGPEASAIPLTKYDLFAPLRLASDKLAGLVRRLDQVALPRWKADEEFQVLAYSVLAQPAPEAALRAFFSKPAPPGARF